jgi:hypothetical protein
VQSGANIVHEQKYHQLLVRLKSWLASQFPFAWNMTLTSVIFNCETAVTFVFSFSILLSILLNAPRTKYSKFKNKNLHGDKIGLHIRILAFMGEYIFPQYNGKIEKDRIVPSLAAICAVTVLRATYQMSVKFIVLDPNLRCEMEAKGNSLWASIFYSCCQWFLYTKASIVHVSSDSSSKPFYLRILQIAPIVILLAYSITSGVTTHSWLDSSQQCISTVSEALVIFVVCLDFPLQIFNFAAFYIPLRDQIRSMEQYNSPVKSNLSEKEIRARNNTEEMYQAAKRSMWICIFSLAFIQVIMIPVLLQMKNIGDPAILDIVQAAGYFAFNISTCSNVSSKWGCKQFNLYSTKEEIRKHEKGNHMMINKPSNTTFDETIASPSGSKSPRISTIEEDPRKSPLLIELQSQ